jgi:hypothetical protein
MTHNRLQIRRPPLNTENPDPSKERLRRCVLQLLAVGAGVFTVLLARGAIPKDLVDVSTTGGVIALGLLASGGSGFWNTILTYFAKVKDIKEIEAEDKKKATPLAGKLGNP